MANLSKTKTVFAFTSPRTIEKIIPEIHILVDKFRNQEWNASTQKAFFDELFYSEFYEGNIYPKDPAFAARDRITRAPKGLGFIDLKPQIELTEVGKCLLSGKRTNEVIAKQLFKFQLPSPYHRISSEREFNVRPYLELLRLVNELGNISKMEIAIFFVQITHFLKFDSILNAIKIFREKTSSYKGNKKEFIDKVFTKEILKIYDEEIKINDFKTRESRDKTLAKFIKTKKSNHIDYADAFIRYLRATQLTSFDKRTFRVIIAPSKTAEVNFILKNVERKALSFKSEKEFKNYLFASETLTLLTDNKEYIEEKLEILKVKYSSAQTVEELKGLLDSAERKKISENIHQTETSLKNYKEFDDVITIFSKIQRKEIPDPPLYLEWNIWRAMVMINYAREVKGNFSLDLDGLPLNTALGNIPDIEIQYQGFKLIIEVTMSSGNKQYEMEGEPVARHYGNVQRKSDDPVYCIFIAPKISEGALAHFFNLNRLNTKAYGGKTRILPISLAQFITFIFIAREKKFNDSKILKSYLDSLIEKNFVLEDETIWFDEIQKSIPTWVSES